MVTLQKSGDSAVKFVFTDSDHYLYGNGEIEVPVNSLLLVIDESEMVTFKKISGDPFLSFRADNSNLGTKAAIEQFYKDNMVGSTGGGGGGGVTSGQVQSMIDESISGKADTSAITAVDNALSAYSATTDARLAEDEEVTAAALNDLQENKADTSAVTAVNDALTAHTANTTVHVTSAEKTAWNAKQDALYIYTEDNNLGTAELHSNDSSIIFNAGGASITANNAMGVNTFNVASTGVTINGENVLTDGIISTAITSGSTDSEIPTAKATYDAIQAGGGGSANVIELTQAQYDALSGSVDPSAIYVITDATAYDPSTKVDTSAITSSVTSASTDTQIPTAKAVYDAIPTGGTSVTVDQTLDSGSTNPVANSAITNAINAKQDALSAGTGIEISGNVISATGGGGATYNAGTNISIDTANTISCTLPIIANDSYNPKVMIGYHDQRYINNFVTGNYGVSIGFTNYINGQRSVCLGSDNQANGYCSVAANAANTAQTNYSFACGYKSKTSNLYEFGCGAYNNSVTGSTASGQTLFSVGNGASTSARHNAFEIRQNGDIYVNDGTNDVRLQDTILALGGLKFVQCTQAEYDALVSGGTVDSSTIYFITNVVS